MALADMPRRCGGAIGRFVSQVRGGLLGDPSWLMPLIALIGSISFGICMLLKHDPGVCIWGMIRHGVDDGPFEDFFMHYGLASNPRHLYETGQACFPPLAYVGYRIMYLMTTDGAVLPVGSSLGGGYARFTGRLLPSVCCFSYMALSVVLLYIAICETGKKSPLMNLSLLLAAMFSPAMMFAAYVQANSVIYVMPIVLLAVAMRDSDVRWKRETALVLFAVAVALKLYPVFFVCLYIHDRRYAEIARCAAYSAALVLVPFVWFGGFDGLVNLTANLLILNVVDVRPEYLLGALSMLFGTLMSQDASAIAARIVFALIASVSFIDACTCDNGYIRLTIIACMMMFVPAGAYRYTLSYMAIPAVAYAKRLYGEPGTHELVCFSMLFGLLASMPTWLAMAVSFNRLMPSGYSYMTAYLYGIAYVTYAIALSVGTRMSCLRYWTAENGTGMAGRCTGDRRHALPDAVERGEHGG